MLKEPNYIYHINPEKFEPVCNFTIDKTTNEPVFEFSDEWISDTEVDISDNNQVRKVEEVRDVTNILENHTILCDKYSQRIGMKAITFKNKEEGMCRFVKHMRHYLMLKGFIAILLFFCC